MLNEAHSQDKVELVSRKYISQKRIDQLNRHGLKLSIKKLDSFLESKRTDIEGRIEAVFYEHDYIEQVAKESGISLPEAIDKIFLNDTCRHENSDGVAQIYASVYDIGESGKLYTVTQSDATNDFNICGSITIPKQIFLNLLRINSMEIPSEMKMDYEVESPCNHVSFEALKEVLSEEALKSLEDWLNRHLERVSILDNEGEYLVSVLGYSGEYFARGSHGYKYCRDYKDAINDAVNSMVNFSVQAIEESGVFIDIEISEDLQKTGINPFGYINKMLAEIHGIKIPFGYSFERERYFTPNVFLDKNRLVTSVNDLYGSTCNNGKQMINNWADELSQIKGENCSTTDSTSEILNWFLSRKGVTANADMTEEDMHMYLSMLRMLLVDVRGIKVKGLTIDEDRRTLDDEDLDF